MMKSRMPPKHISKILKIWKKFKNHFHNEKLFGKTHLFYRISDGSYEKEKPRYISKKTCLRNCYHVFKNSEIHLIADNVQDETWSWIESQFPHIKKERTSFGNGALSFNHALSIALKLPLNDIIYFVEDDYLHRRHSYTALKEGIMLGADYVTLYDHPDKYLDTDNPFVDKDGEVTKVLLTKSSHWKMTSSTTMTFASTVNTLRKDEEILRIRTCNDHPDDFNMFADLADLGRSLVSPIPGFCTHGQSDFLSPRVDWEKVSINFDSDQN